MSSLSLWALGIGAIKLAVGLFGAIAPSRAANMLRSFPRSVWPGRALSTIDLVWAAILLNAMPMGAFDSWKLALYVLCPLAIILVPVYLDELLAPRALGGLYLLLAGPILDAARWHPSPLAVLFSLLAYLMIIAGMAFVLSPYLLNRMLSLVARDERACRVSAWGGIAVGVLFIGLGIFAY